VSRRSQSDTAGDAPIRDPDHRRTLVGVVHLLSLPGNPIPSPGLGAVLARAREDALALAQGGVDAIIVENLGDAPFAKDHVSPYTVAAMTRAVEVVQEAAPGVEIGVNVLRNDALSALAIATATGADFIRINVHTGAMVTDQGLIEGRARETLLARAAWGGSVRIVADVAVKHAVPLGPMPLAVAARDTFRRGRADVLVVTGTGTGAPTDADHVREVRRAVPEALVWIGSGLTPERASQYGGAAHGAIVGTFFHEDGDLAKPVDPRRVAVMRSAW
jgi:hypothetical protein